MRRIYNFNKAKAVNLRKIDYWIRIGLFGLPKPSETAKYKNLKRKRKLNAKMRVSRNEMTKTF